MQRPSGSAASSRLTQSPKAPPASRFSDPLVRLPCGISVVVMTLAGFGLVLLWGQAGDDAIVQTEMQ